MRSRNNRRELFGNDSEDYPISIFDHEGEGIATIDSSSNSGVTYYYDNTAFKQNDGK